MSLWKREKIQVLLHADKIAAIGNKNRKQFAPHYGLSAVPIYSLNSSPTLMPLCDRLIMAAIISATELQLSEMEITTLTEVTKGY
jgi:hypothetical protein